MKYTKISTFTVLTIVASTMLATGLVTAISTANEADAAHRNTINSNNQQSSSGGSGGSGSNGGNGGTNTATNTQTTVCNNGACVTTTN